MAYTLPSGKSVDLWDAFLTEIEGTPLSKTVAVGDSNAWSVARANSYCGPTPVDDPVPGICNGRWLEAKGQWQEDVPPGDDPKNQYEYYRGQLRLGPDPAAGQVLPSVSRPDLHPGAGSRLNAIGAGDNYYFAWQFMIPSAPFIEQGDPPNTGDASEAAWGYSFGEQHPYLGDRTNGSNVAGKGAAGLNIEQSMENPNTHFRIRAESRYNPRYNFEADQAGIAEILLPDEFTFDVLHTIILRIKWSTYPAGYSTGDSVSWNSDGVYQMWIDGALVYNLTNGKLGFANSDGGHFKTPFYCATFKNVSWGCGSKTLPGWFESRERVVYFTNVIGSRDTPIVHDPDMTTLPNVGGAVPGNQVLTPYLVNVPSEPDTSPIDVEIACDTPSSTIHYTTNGSTPTTSSPVYTAPVPVTQTTTIKALAIADGLDNSAILTEVVTILVIPRLPAGKVNAGDTVQYGDFVPDDGYTVGGFSQYSNRAIINDTGEPDEIFYSRAVVQPDLERATAFDLAAGATYKIFLYWCEQFHQTAAQRLVTISVNGEVLAASVDLFAGLNIANKVEVGSFVATGEDDVTVTSNGPDNGAYNALWVSPDQEAPGPSEGKTYLESGGQTVIEAENAVESVSRNGYSWAETTAYPNYQGASAIEAVPADPQQQWDANDARLNAPEQRYNIVSAGGVRYLWARALRPGGASTKDSLHFGVGGTIPSTSEALQVGGSGDWDVSNTQFSTGNRITVTLASGLNVLSAYPRENGVVLDLIILTADPDFTPTGFEPESPESVNLSEVRLSDAGADGATVHATFAGYAEDVLPDGYELEIEGFATVATLPYVASGVSDTVAPPAPVLSRSLDEDGSTIHLTATLVADNGTQFAPRARGVVNGAAATDWVDSTPIELTPSGTDQYLFQRRENGGNWEELNEIPATDPTIIDDTEGWSGLIEHRVYAGDVAGNNSDWSNVVSTQSGQVTTVTVTNVASDSFVVNVETAAGYNVIPAGESVEIHYEDGTTVTLTDVDTLPYTETGYADNVAPDAPTGSLYVDANTVLVQGIFGTDYGRNLSVKARETIATVWQDYSPTVPIAMTPSGFGAMNIEVSYDDGPWNPDERAATETPYTWSFPVPAVGTTSSFRATGTDEAGNTSGYSNVVSYSVASEAEVVMFAPVQIRPL